jgi:hypothetical protein
MLCCADIRQCLIYDSPNKGARLIGVEYMVSPRIFDTLPSEERKLWHTHTYEVKSGMLIMPTPAGLPNAAWEAAETSEMRDIIPLYGKTYHLWQVDRGDPVPLGEPKLMLSFTDEEKVKNAVPGGLDELVKERDRAFGVDTKVKREKRADIEATEKHPGMSCFPKSASDLDLAGANYAQMRTLCGRFMRTVAGSETA